MTNCAYFLGDRYQITNVGWDGHRRVHSCVLHLDIIDDKVWNESYFIASCGGVTVTVLKKYIEKQDSPDLGNSGVSFAQRVRSTYPVVPSGSHPDAE
jgi:hypothetical protein